MPTATAEILREQPVPETPMGGPLLPAKADAPTPRALTVEDILKLTPQQMVGLSLFEALNPDRQTNIDKIAGLRSDLGKQLLAGKDTLRSIIKQIQDLNPPGAPPVNEALLTRLEQIPTITPRAFGETAGKSDGSAWRSVLNQMGLLATALAGTFGGFPQGALAALSGAMQGWAAGDQERQQREWANWEKQTEGLARRHQLIMDHWHALNEKYGHDQSRLTAMLTEELAALSLDKDILALAVKTPEAAIQEIDRRAGLFGTTARTTATLRQAEATQALKAEVAKQTAAYREALLGLRLSPKPTFEQETIRKMLREKLGRDPTDAELLAEEQRLKVEVAKVTGEARASAWAQTRGAAVYDRQTGKLVEIPWSELGRPENRDRYAPAGPQIQIMNRTALIEDIRGGVQLVRKALNELPDFTPAVRAQLALVLRDTDPRSAMQAFFRSTVATTLTSAQQDYVVNLVVLMENAMAMRSVLGAGQGSDMLRSAILATIPAAGTPDKQFAAKQLNAFEGVLNRLARGLPVVELRPEMPVGSGPAQPDNPLGLNIGR